MVSIGTAIGTKRLFVGESVLYVGTNTSSMRRSDKYLQEKLYNKNAGFNGLFMFC